MVDMDHANVSELEEELQLRCRQLQALHRLVAELNSITELDETIEQALDTTLEIMDAGAGSIILYDEEKDRLVFRYVVGEKAEELLGMELDPDAGGSIAASVFHTGETRVSDDMSVEKDHDREVGEKVDYVTQNMVTIPLRTRDEEPIGVIQVLNKSDGRFDGTDVATLDIMAVQVASAIEAARLHEEARLAEVVKFIGNISHDVKNMITPVKTAAETIEVVNDDTFEEFTEQLKSSECPQDLEEDLRVTLEQLHGLIPEMVEMMIEGTDTVQQRMAEISAAVKGMVAEPHFEMAEIVPLAERAVRMLEHQASEEGIELAVETHGNIPEVALDKKQIYNAIYNLVFNAIDACESGDDITVVISSEPDGQFPDGSYCQVDCVDTGSGMPPEVQKKLFTEDAVSTKPMGTGLGTKIVGNVVDAHGGIIRVDSEQGVGTSISFKIPLERREQPEAGNGE